MSLSAIQNSWTNPSDMNGLNSWTLISMGSGVEVNLTTAPQQITWDVTPLWDTIPTLNGGLTAKMANINLLFTVPATALATDGWIQVTMDNYSPTGGLFAVYPFGQISVAQAGSYGVETGGANGDFAVSLNLDGIVYDNELGDVLSRITIYTAGIPSDSAVSIRMNAINASPLTLRVDAGVTAPPVVGVAENARDLRSIFTKMTPEPAVSTVVNPKQETLTKLLKLNKEAKEAKEAKVTKRRTVK